MTNQWIARFHAETVTVQVAECFKHPLHLFPVLTRITFVRVRACACVCVCFYSTTTVMLKRCACVRARDSLTCNAHALHASARGLVASGPGRVVCRRPNKATLTPGLLSRERERETISQQGKTKVGCRWINLNNLFTIVRHIPQRVHSVFLFIPHSFSPYFSFRLRC